MLIVLEILFFIFGLYAIVTTKLPAFLVGGGNYKIEGPNVRILGLLLALPLPVAFIGGLLLGLLFGVVSTPCATPILAIVLTYVASSGSSLLYGGALLLVYALGHSVLILAAGTSVGFAKGFLESKGLTRVTSGLRKGAGGLIILVGIYLLLTT